MTRAGSEQTIDAMIAHELRVVGYDVESVLELRDRYDRWPDAVPVLVRWLPIVPTRNLKESILRSLTVRSARHQALDAVITEFSTIKVAIDPSGHLRWAAGNALEVLWDDRRFDDLRALVLDRRWGRARQMLVLGLGRSRHPDAVATAIALLEDDEVVGHAATALAKLRPARESDADAALEAAAVRHHERWVLKALDKARRQVGT